MIDGGPLNGGASAELVIHDEFTLLGNIKDRLESVVCVAFADVRGGQMKFQLMSSNHRTFTELLKNTHALASEMLPIFIVLTQHDPASDATPEPVS